MTALSKPSQAVLSRAEALDAHIDAEEESLRRVYADHALFRLFHAVRLVITTNRELLLLVEAQREALGLHHQWHQDIGIVSLDGHELNLSLEYTDSTMCEKTMDALAHTDETLKRLGAE